MAAAPKWVPFSDLTFMEIFGFPVQLSDVCWTLLVLFAVSSIYDWVGWIIWRYKYNIKGTFPVPIFGIFLDFLLHPSADDAKRRMLKHGPVHGGNAGPLKMIIVQDVDLLKKVLITNHAQFQNRYSMMGLYHPPPADKTLLELKDGEWKRVRSIVTPSFSSGKLKMMSKLISQCSETLVKGLVDQAKKGAVIEPRKHFGCYTMDVIASTAFGIETDSYNNPEDPFIQNAQKVFTTSTFDPLLILSMLYPRFGTLLVSLFGYSAYWPKGPLQFFRDVTKKVIDGRQKDGDYNRVDLLQLMLNAELHDSGETTDSKRIKNLTLDEIQSQSFIVFIAGYETTSSLLNYAAYVLATHPDVQDILISEIDKAIPQDCQQVTYNHIMEMPYLDMVVNETLRMYPPITRMDRTTSASQDVQLEGYWFPRDTMVVFDMHLMHHDETIYPEPDKFIPERFSAEGKSSRDPFTFMPFGHGPRNCIGMRLALLEAKIALVVTLRKVMFVRATETEVPLNVLTSDNFLRTKNPIKVSVMLR